MKLYVVPTPIGNLEDITLRATRILKEVDFILCEDTRVSIRLLSHLGFNKPLVSFHLHNEHKKLEDTIQKIRNSSGGVALISDAGTPGISDPGFLLVRACVQENIPIETLPGATAFVPALVNSGLPTDKFIFEGFLPQKKGRETAIKRIAQHEITTVLYESPHRIVKCLEQLILHCGPNRLCSVSREISKKFEETKRGTLEEICAHFKQNEPKGEFVIVLNSRS
ncbi:MAG: 16S rRNA (cytidine(1402)-2'-O)-methyltransferase [Bacteroidota bacterium]